MQTVVHSFESRFMSQFSVSATAAEETLVVRPGKWTFTLISLLRTETLRFNELKREAHGISQKTLTVTLRELERDGFVSRTMFPTIPPRVEYHLTELGRELLEMADMWHRFAERNRQAIEKAREQFDGAGRELAIRLVHVRDSVSG
jgi:DNA-binding HxlR family transcriptional regulator